VSISGEIHRRLEGEDWRQVFQPAIPRKSRDLRLQRCYQQVRLSKWENSGDAQTENMTNSPCWYFTPARVASSIRGITPNKASGGFKVLGT